MTKSTHANKGLAAAAAKRAGLKNFEIRKTGGGRYKAMTATEIESSPLFDASKRERSTVEGAVGLVWDIAASMINAGAKRADILQACVDAGVNINTARTQVQAYRKAAGLVKAKA